MSLWIDPPVLYSIDGALAVF